MTSYFPLRLLLASFFLSIAVACTPKSGDDANSSERKTDMTQDVLAKSANRTFQRGQTRFGLGSDGSFDLVMDINLRYFPPTNANGTSEKESDARCLVRLSGSVRFVDPLTDYGSGVTAKIEAKFNVASASVESSSVLRPDLVGVNPATNCGNYASQVVTRKNFNILLIDYGTNFFAFDGLDFNIYDESTRSALFGIEEHLGTDATKTVNGLGVEYTYFVQAGSSINVTGRILSDLDGTFRGRDGTDVTLIVSSKTQDLLLTSPSCGVTFRYDVTSVDFRGDSLQMTSSPSELSSYENRPEINSQCDELKTLIQRLSQGPIQIRYWDDDSKADKRTMNLSFVLANSAAGLPTFNFRSVPNTQ